MPAMRSIFQPACVQELERRLGTLNPASSRRWGRMSSHQAVCHLSDSFKAALGERTPPRRCVSLRRRVIRFIAFTLPFPWPHGVRTSPEMDALKGGTPPAFFERDVAELKTLLRRFAATDGKGLEPHYAWGDLSRGEWGRYAYRHVDHHLRQFSA